MKTKLGPAPFPGKQPKPPKTKQSIDLSAIKKTRDPYKPGRVINDLKYDGLFAGVKEGDCFVVPGNDAVRSAFAAALRRHLKRNGIEGIVRQEGRTDDGIGRVWLLKIIRPRLEAVA